MSRRGRKLYGKIIRMGRARGLTGRPPNQLVREFFEDVFSGKDVRKALKDVVDKWEEYEMELKLERRAAFGSED